MKTKEPKFKLTEDQIALEIAKAEATQDTEWGNLSMDELLLLRQSRLPTIGEADEEMGETLSQISSEDWRVFSILFQELHRRRWRSHAQEEQHSRHHTLMLAESVMEDVKSWMAEDLLST